MKKNKVVKSIVAICLVIVLIALFCPKELLNTVQASDINKHAVVKDEIINGNFAAGEVDGEVKNWTKTSMNSLAQDTSTDYTSSFDLKTKRENGNKIASLKKHGAGYTAMTSEKMRVEGKEAYRLSLDYKMVDFSLDDPEATSGINLYGIRFVVEQFDENDNRLEYTRYPESGAIIERQSVGWNTHYEEFITHENAKSVAIHIWLGGEFRVNATVLIDNVRLKQADEFYLENGDFDKVNYQKHNAKAVGEAGPAGWNVVGVINDGYVELNGSILQWVANRKNTVKATTEEVAGRGNVVVMERSDTAVTNDAQAYAILQSEKISVNGEKSCDITADCRLVCYDAQGNESTDYAIQRIGFNFVCYDVDNNIIDEKVVCHEKTKDSGQMSGSGSNDTRLLTTNNQWKKLWYKGAQTVRGTAYVKIGLFVGYEPGETTNPPGGFKCYFDNVTFEAEGAMQNWTKEGCIADAKPGNTDAVLNYGFQRIDGGADHEEGLQLYNKRPKGLAGGVVVYSEPIKVQGGMEYNTSYDLKIENYIAEEDTDGKQIYGATTTIRFLDKNKKAINADTPKVLGNKKNNMDWTKFSHDIEIPEEAAYVQFGLSMGSDKSDICKDMKYSIDNIVIIKNSSYVLFVGEQSGSDLAVQAATGNQMKVADACASNSVAEQLTQYQNEEFDCIFIIGGKTEKEENLPAGTVDITAHCMNTAGYDDASFAGRIENTFLQLAECYNNTKVLYLLNSSDVAYTQEAQKAAEKWGVTLVLLGDETDAQTNWNSKIAPQLESAVAMDVYQLSGVLEYLTNKTEKVAASANVSLSNIMTLDKIKAKAEDCPEKHPQYADYTKLAVRIDEILLQKRDFSPIICGGTVNPENPNTLGFVALAPKYELAEGATVKRMGVLTVPEEYVNAQSPNYKEDAALLIDNAYVTVMQEQYQESGKEYIVKQEFRDVDPYKKYVAAAFIEYELNGQTHVSYSVDDYTNSIGIKTATGGQCVKSVFGITKDMALQLVAQGEKDMDYTAIGGKENVLLISTAEKDSDVSLFHVFEFVRENKEVLKNLLNEGGQEK